MSINSLKLEIVRPGPLHGQLLSRLTNYVVLCEGVEADTIRLPFDHYQIKADLDALRYFVGGQNDRVPNDLRAAALDRLSRSLADVLAEMVGFQTRLAEMARQSTITHLRLVLGGGELSLVPFELSTLPAGWRGAGGNMSLDSAPPVVVTRELRDSPHIPLTWNRRPRILFCTASPDGYAPVPDRAHLLAILRALRPWIDGGQEQGKRLQPKDVVTVLTNASLDAIRAATRKATYTHVHFLCHGCRFPGNDERYGLVLARPGQPHAAELVDASMLANALWDRSDDGQAPTMVMLASCDSANQATVVAPGSSLAHELHRNGVPWVVASQFPLTFRGSATLARTFYEGILAGRDPRGVLYQVRRELSRQRDSHDWASVAVYATVPADLDEQVKGFRIRQLRRFIESAFARASDEYVKRNLDKAAEEFTRVDTLFDEWKREVESSGAGAETSEYLGMKASAAKQRAELAEHVEERHRWLDAARAFYREALDKDLRNHWVVVQYLSLSLFSSSADPSERWLFQLAERSAKRELGDPKQRIWAIGSLLELAILDENGKAAGKTSREWADALVEATKPDDFERFSTLRQLRRYTSGLLRDQVDEATRIKAKEATERLMIEGQRRGEVR